MARTISTTYSTGISLTNTADNPITVTGTITPSTGTALYGQGGGTNSWTITNSGLISATSSGASGVVLGSPASPVAQGLVTNQATGTLSGYAFGVSINPTGSVANAGAISGGTAGVYLGSSTYSPNAGSVTNLTGGTISSTNIGVDISGSGSVTNQSGGTISGVNVAAVYITGYGSVQQTAVNVYNVGTLSGATGVAEYRGGSVTNLAGGTITGTINAAISLAGLGTVVNAGLVSGATTGVDLFEGGTVDNLAGGRISAASGVYIGYVGTTVGRSLTPARSSRPAGVPTRYNSRRMPLITDLSSIRGPSSAATSMVGMARRNWQPAAAPERCPASAAQSPTSAPCSSITVRAGQYRAMRPGSAPSAPSPGSLAGTRSMSPASPPPARPSPATS